MDCKFLSKIEVKCFQFLQTEKSAIFTKSFQNNIFESFSLHQNEHKKTFNIIEFITWNNSVTLWFVFADVSINWTPHSCACACPSACVTSLNSAGSSSLLPTLCNEIKLWENAATNWQAKKIHCYGWCVLLTQHYRYLAKFFCFNFLNELPDRP